MRAFKNVQQTLLWQNAESAFGGPETQDNLSPQWPLFTDMVILSAEQNKQKASSFSLPEKEQPTSPSKEYHVSSSENCVGTLSVKILLCSKIPH